MGWGAGGRHNRLPKISAGEKGTKNLNLQSVGQLLQKSPHNTLPSSGQ